VGRPRHARPDQNQSQIIEELESLGFVVFNVSQLAHLGYDLVVVGFHRRWLLPIPLLVEVKTDGGELTDREAEVQAEMQYRFKSEAPIITAYRAEDVLDWFNARQ